MYRPGHYGAALLLTAPLSFVLGWPGGAVFSAVVLATTMLPDVDTRLSSVRHRGITHTLAFAVGVGLVGSLVGAVGWHVLVALDPGLVGPIGPFPRQDVGSSVGGAALFVGGSSFLGCVSHLAADALTPGEGPNAMRPLWPLSPRVIRLGVADVDSPTWNWGLLLVGLLAQAVAFSLTQGVW